MYIDAKVTSKHQITVPREVREVLEIGPGDRVRFVRDEKGFRVVRRRVPAALDFYGALGPAPVGRPVSVEEMSDAIADAAAERFRRSTGTE